MLREDFFAAVCGPPLASNTAVAKDAAIYHQTLSPAPAVQATFKKSATPVGGLAVSAGHVFAAQQDRAYVHVYSRLRGGQEAFVPVPEKVRCVALAGDVLVAGTVEGRLLLWEGVSCLATTPYHVLSGSDDANVHVWSLPQLLALGGGSTGDEPEPERTLARHRAAVTSVVVGGSCASRDTNLCASASRDKTVVLWNYQTGVALRTLLFPAVPLCVVLDPVARALYVATTGDEEKVTMATAAAASAATADSLFAVELFGDKPLVGARAVEAASTAVSITTPFGAVPTDAGPAACLAVSYDGATLLSGHARGRILQWNLGDAGGSSGSALPTELANLNAAVTNLVFVAPALPTSQQAAAVTAVPARTTTHTVVKPSQMGRDYTVTVAFDEAPWPDMADVAGVMDAADTANAAEFDAAIHQHGFPTGLLDRAILALEQHAQDAPAGKKTAGAAGAGDAAAMASTDAELRRQNEALLEVVNEQHTLYQEALQRIAELKAARS